MLDQVTKIMSVFFISMIKFMGGPLSGTLLGMKPLEIILICVLGMMTSVAVFSLFGGWIKSNIFDRFRKPVLFTSKNRQIVKMWNKFGLHGVAFLTPIFLTPIGGTIIASSFGESKQRIFIYMLVSCVLWAIALTFSFAYFKTQLIQWHT